MSVFSPVDKSLYQVIYSVKQNELSTIILHTPSPSLSDLQKIEQKDNSNEKKPKIVKAVRLEKQNAKKIWISEERNFAIQQAQSIGIAKALRMLQCQFPSVYGDLSPSTLQYWVSRNRKLM